MVQQMMTKTILATCFAALLAGCGGLPEVQEVPISYEVRVPVPVPCIESLPPKPTYSFPLLKDNKNATIYDKVKAMLSDMLLRQAYIAEVDAILISCIKTKE